MQQPIILASTSTTRQNLLKAAGLHFTTVASPADEENLKRLKPHLSPADTSIFLALEKAKAVAHLNHQALVIGADQTLEHNAVQFSKPNSIEETKIQLQRLRGTTHTLYSSVACVCHEEILWQHTAQAKLTMRNFSDRYLDEYLATCGMGILSSVGGYQIEHHGVRLFNSIEGDHTTILGLPIMPLLTFLFDRKFIAS